METFLHNLDMLMSAAALLISIIALIVALSKKGGSAASSASAAPASATPGAQLQVNMIKMPSDTGHGVIAQDFRFWLTNIGTGTAYNVNFSVDLPEEVLFAEEVQQKLPADMSPGERVELCSRVGMRTPKVFRTIVEWDDANGLTFEQEFMLTKETEGA